MNKTACGIHFSDELHKSCPSRAYPHIYPLYAGDILGYICKEHGVKMGCREISMPEAIIWEVMNR